MVIGDSIDSMSVSAISVSISAPICCRIRIRIRIRVPRFHRTESTYTNRSKVVMAKYTTHQCKDVETAKIFRYSPPPSFLQLFSACGSASDFWQECLLFQNLRCISRDRANAASTRPGSAVQEKHGDLVRRHCVGQIGQPDSGGSHAATSCI